MDRYERRGVSSSKPEVHAAVAVLDKGLFPGAFCQIMPYTSRCHAVKHSDGAGTKAGLAYLAHKHGFPIEIWRGITQDSFVMNMDDVACVGAARGELTYFTQSINRNPFYISGEILAELIAGGVDFTRKMSAYGLNIVLAGGETADVPDLVRTITVDSDIFTTIHNKDVVSAERIEEGDIIIGFSSTGQAVWEDEPNSGIGSNGLTNARHDCLSPKYRADTETYSPEMPADEVYCGTYELNDPLPGDSNFTVGSALLSPTRTYVPLIAELLKRDKKKPHALIHCSGGGQTKIGNFGPADVEYYKNDLLPIPPLFWFLQKVRNLPWREMLKSYNCGHRLEAVVPRDCERLYIDTAAEFGILANKIGEVRRRTDKERVLIKTAHGTFKY